MLKIVRYKLTQAATGLCVYAACHAVTAIHDSPSVRFDHEGVVELCGQLGVYKHAPQLRCALRDNVVDAREREGFESMREAGALQQPIP